MDLRFERNLWRETAFRFWEAKPIIAVIVALFIGLSILESVRGGSTGNSGSMIAWAVLAMVVHNAILNGSKASWSQGKFFWPFLWRSIALSLPGIAAVILFLISYRISDDRETMALSALPIYGAVTALVFSLWGTWLPSVVATGGNRSLAAATRRGRQTFLYVLLRMIVGCGVVAAAAFIFLIAASVLAEKAGLRLALSEELDLVQLLIEAFGYLAFAFNFVMLPVILSRAYLLAEARSQTGPAPAALGATATDTAKGGATS